MGTIPEPDRFDPERFSETAVAERPKFAFFPFGGGSKLCIGEPLARLEAVILIGLLAQYFVVEAVENRTITPRPAIVLEPDRAGCRSVCARRV